MLQDNKKRHKSSSIKESYEATKFHVNRINPTANQTEEAFERFQKNADSNVDTARMLFNMHNKYVTDPQTARVELSKTETSTSRPFRVERPTHVDLPEPKYGSRYYLLEIWDIFHNLEKGRINML